MLITVFRDRDSTHEFHHEIRTTGFSGPGIEYLGDTGMVHQGKCLPFGLESGDDTPGIHAGLDDFQGDSAINGFLLFRHEHHAAPALTNLLKQLVSADAVTWLFPNQVYVQRPRVTRRRL